MLHHSPMKYFISLDYGVVFNAKYVFSNVAVLSAVYGLDFATKKISALLKMKKEKVLVSSI